MKRMVTAAVLAACGVAGLARADPPEGFDTSSRSDRPSALGIAYELLDHYLDQPRYDWGAAWQEVVRQRDERAVAVLKQQTSTPARVGPSLPLERYAGEFADAWYGEVAIAHRDGRLTLDFKQTPGMSGELKHWQYDTFRVDWRDPLIEPA
jgi:hypothetical protein